MVLASARRFGRRLGKLWPALADYARGRVTESRPSVLILAPAARCNATCTFCFDYKRVEAQNVSLPQFRILLDKLEPHIEMVDFSYLGEPTLNAELPALVREARGRGLGTVVYTNGMLLDGERGAALASSGVDVVVVNLNAWSKDYKLTDPADLPDRRVEQVNRFMRACAPDTLVVLQVIAPRGRTAFARRALSDRFENPGNRLLRVKSEEKYSYDGPATRPAPVRCFRPFEEITVAPDGAVVVCCKDMLRKTGFGNLFTDDLETIWVDRMNALRARNDEPLCVHCEAPGDASRFVAGVLFTPVGARKLYLRAASLLF